MRQLPKQNRSAVTRSTEEAFSTRSLALATTALLLLTLVGCSDESEFDVSSQIGPDPVLPEPSTSLLPDMKVAEVVGWSEGELPTVPDGLTISAYATDLANPRTVHTLPNGDVLVVQGKAPGGKPLERPKDYIRGFIMSLAKGGGGGPQKDSNLITLLRDLDRDGTVDERHDLLTDLNSPFGVAYADETLYVAAADAVLSYPYTLGETSITAEPEILTPLPGGPINHHWTKDLALSPDGTMLYASVGSNSNAAERGLEAEKGRAAIWEIDRETGAARIYASGLRNPNGLTFHPDTGVLWAVINERDELGPNLVPDYLTSVRDGAFYGWPWSYFGDHVDERVHPPRPDMVERAIAPDYSLSSHVAALGLTFSMNSALPEQFASGAIIGEHGSWNRDTFNGYKVVYIPFEDGMPAGDPVDLVTGFLNGDQARGRPVGTGIDGTGALLVADDAGNTVWRVAAADGTVTPEPIATDARPTQTPTASTAPAANTPPEDGSPASPTATEDGSVPGVVSPTQADGATNNGSGASAQPGAPLGGAPESDANAGPPDNVDGAADASGSGGSEAQATPTPPQTEIAPAVLPPGTVEDVN
ncbi:PQQ-dependent sugar dehydrogenase [Peteryoungia desertarenae]|uniref:PQQ-dependent sugar dehydrogenase n=1 Tax=Peteryoungia desertarenae TaxID=1813451 RepID=A0ABX6QSW6_9HYPH|nr:sorbosone dehydrogenase family protein [Peteryoungia desertarenae]QLF71392.1 PQQ-dependent sugar dehydrogenase [Peteryoungia desertarenae]